MDIAKQYIDLFDQARQLIDKPCPPLMNSQRQDAYARVLEKGLLPDNKEKYAHTDINGMFAPDYGLNLNRLPIPFDPYDVFRCDVPNLSTFLYFTINDQTYPNDHSSVRLPEGVYAGSLNQFISEKPEIASKYYNKQAQNHTDGPTALNTMFAQDGFVLYVPRSVRMEKPLQLINVLKSDVDFMVNRRILIIIEAFAEAKLLVCDHAMNGVNYLANQVIEVFVDEGAYFDYYEIEENNNSTHRISSYYLSQERNSNVQTSLITLMTGVSRNNAYVTFAGEGAETHLSGMTIQDGAQQVDNYTFIDHAVPNCMSKELFKFILNDQAQGSFAGRILVREGAQKTEAYQSNKNLCATDEARMFTRPELEIYADDVKCSHGATVGQLDDNALFYLRSRGISEKEARMLLMFAFTSDVIDQIRLEPLKERLKQLVEKRFRGELAKCRGCNDCH